MTAGFRLRAERRPPSIGASCTIWSRIYKNVGGVLPVSPCRSRNSTIFQLFYFCFYPPACLMRNAARLKTLSRAHSKDQSSALRTCMRSGTGAPPVEKSQFAGPGRPCNTWARCPRHNKEASHTRSKNHHRCIRRSRRPRRIVRSPKKLKTEPE